MARLARLIVPGYPHHIVQRGNNRQDIFLDDADRERYLWLLAEAAKRYAVPIHAFVLMSNHIHLLATPPDSTAIAAVMQSVGRAYVPWFNKRRERTGTLFEGRFRSSVVDADYYLFACARYIEMNAVRAGMVESPADYRWSSYRHNVGLEKHPLITEHAAMWGLGNTPFERQSAYKKMFEIPIDERATTLIKSSFKSGLPLGRESWIQGLAKQQTRRVVAGQAGRPKSASR